MIIDMRKIMATVLTREFPASFVTFAVYYSTVPLWLRIWCNLQRIWLIYCKFSCKLQRC